MTSEWECTEHSWLDGEEPRRVPWAAYKALGNSNVKPQTGIFRGPIGLLIIFIQKLFPDAAAAQRREGTCPQSHRLVHGRTKLSIHVSEFPPGFSLPPMLTLQWLRFHVSVLLFDLC